MAYKKVVALVAATIPLSIGMFRFDPDGEDERYHGGVFPVADAKKIVAKEIGEIDGDATAEEFAAFFTSLSNGAVDQDRIQNYMKWNADKAQAEAEDGEEVKPAKLSKAAATARRRAVPDDAGPAASGGNKGVREIKSIIRETSDTDLLKSMLKDERDGPKRESAIKAIEARLRAVDAAALEQADADSEEGAADEDGDKGGDLGAGTETENTPVPTPTPETPAENVAPAGGEASDTGGTEASDGAAAEDSASAENGAAADDSATEDAVEGDGGSEATSDDPDPDAAPLN